MTCASLLEILRPHLEPIGHCVIAGGAVRDELLHRKPNDWDVFVLGQQSGTAVSVVLANLYEVDEGDGSNPGHLTLTIDLEGENVQVIPSPCDGLGSLLETFDWDICLFGWDAGAVCHSKSMLPDGTGTTMSLGLHVVTHPLSTLRRGFRFCDRYGLWMRKDDIRRLCGEVMGEIIAQEEIESEPNEGACQLA